MANYTGIQIFQNFKICKNGSIFKEKKTGWSYLNAFEMFSKILSMKT